MSDRPAVLVLGTADWDQPIATNQHYVARALAEELDVTFVESIGLRRPELSARDVRRVVARVRGARSDLAPRARPAGMAVLSPTVVPHHTGPVRALNARLLRRLVEPWLRRPGPRVLWAYSPVTYGLERLADVTVYHCVDLLAEVPGISADAVGAGERALAGAGAVAVASSPVVREHLERVGFAAPLLWPNVADVATITAARPADPAAGRSARAVFAGNLSPTKVDFALLRALVEAGVDLHLAGPVAEGGGAAGAEVASLVRSGATHHGLLSLDELARLYWTATVGLVPYLLNPYTTGVSPLKTFEYLAAGLHVVSTPVPAVTPVQGDVTVASTTAGYVDAVRLAVDPDPASLDRRSTLARAHGWDLRGAQARALVAQHVGAREHSDG